MNSCNDHPSEFQSVVTDALKAPSQLQPWTRDIKESISKRQPAWANGNTYLYRLHRNKVMKLCKSARCRFYQDSISHMHDINLKKWWDSIRFVSCASPTSSSFNFFLVVTEFYSFNHCLLGVHACDFNLSYLHLDFVISSYIPQPYNL